MKKKDTKTEPEECVTKQPSQQASDSEIQKYKNQLIEAAKYLSEHMTKDEGYFTRLCEQNSVCVNVDCGKIKIDATLYVGPRAKQQNDLERYKQQYWQRTYPSTTAAYMPAGVAFPASMYMNNNSCNVRFDLYCLAWAVIHGKIVPPVETYINRVRMDFTLTCITISQSVKDFVDRSYKPFEHDTTSDLYWLKPMVESMSAAEEHLRELNEDGSPMLNIYRDGTVAKAPTCK